MGIRLLGVVELWNGADLVPAGSPRQSALLAALAVDAGRVVDVDLLVDRVWGEDPPARVRRTLHTYVARLRGTMQRHGGADGRGAAIVRRAGGYLLDIERDRVDIHQFRRLVGESGEVGCEQPQRLALLRLAVGLWHGRPLAGLPGDWAERTRQTWARQHVDAVVAWADAELRAGDPAAVPGPLGDLAGEYPLVESVAAMQIRTLAATGHTAEALTCYAEVRQRLADELGASPGPQLQAVYQAVLRGDFDPPGRVAATGGWRRRAPVVPRQLPPPVRHFAGRVPACQALTALVPAGGGAGTAPVISAVSGTAGVGKSALVLHWAHRVAEWFPDGQLYVDLRGFDPEGQLLPAGEAVRGFLDALGVPARRVPSGLAVQVGLYRSLIAGKRILVVLDNARDAQQVRPLLPAAATAMAVVTSRNQLNPLVAIDGAHLLTLDLLSAAEAGELLALRLGGDRVAAEPRAVRDIVESCARLPLALSIAAGRALQSGFSLATLATHLGNAGQRLDALDGGDPSTQLRAAFAGSYRTLTPDAARLFRLLGLAPGPDIALAAAASLAGQPVPEALRLLDELSRVHLVAEHSPGRYRLHDLLRTYAADLVHRHDPDAQRRAAVLRLLDHARAA